MVSGVHKVVIPVEDEERAREFWTSRLGFAVIRDEQYGAGQRWLEVAPPNRSVVLVLNRRHPDDPRAQVPPQLPHSPVFFHCDDIQETYRELTARGVAFATAPVKMPFGWWAMFEDNDGTRYALAQANASSVAAPTGGIS
jgi:catechol 2,3-dioxygenase-like lactoylglutathione lyase family enzyme